MRLCLVVHIDFGTPWKDFTDLSKFTTSTLASWNLLASPLKRRRDQPLLCPLIRCYLILRHLHTPLHGEGTEHQRNRYHRRSCFNCDDTLFTRNISSCMATYLSFINRCRWSDPILSSALIPIAYHMVHLLPLFLSSYSGMIGV